MSFRTNRRREKERGEEKSYTTCMFACRLYKIPPDPSARVRPLFVGMTMSNSFFTSIGFSSSPGRQ
jgi:hypothetical protein